MSHAIAIFNELWLVFECLVQKRLIKEYFLVAYDETKYIHIVIDAIVTAKVHAYVGVKSYLCVISKDGSTVNISMAKH